MITRVIDIINDCTYLWKFVYLYASIWLQVFSFFWRSLSLVSRYLFSNWSFDRRLILNYVRSGSFCNWCVAQYELQIVCILFPAKIMHSVLMAENLTPVSMSNCKGHLDLFRYRRWWNREQRGYSALAIWRNWPYCQLRLQTG